MRIKKFAARNMKDGKALVIRELGEDAVILSSRTVRNPATGNEMVEIVAALDDSPIKKTKQRYPSASEPVRVEETIVAPEPDKGTESILSATGKLMEEIGALRDSLKSIDESMKYKYSGNFTQTLSEIYKLLRDNDFSEELALGLVGKASAMGHSFDYDAALSAVKAMLADKMHFAMPLGDTKKRRVVAFLGTTGCGKTSSLVKIAVVCKLLLKADILIVSADTYKVGGADQLQTIASIASIPFRAVYSADEMADLVKEESRRDFIFIDTTGRSQKDAAQIAEIKEIVDAANADVKYLVLNSTTSPTVARSIIDAFAGFGITSSVVTKLDEAEALGGFSEVLMKNNLSVSYITNGQKVPEDIAPASPDEFIKLMIKER